MRKVIYSEHVHVPATSDTRQYWKLEPKGEAIFLEFGVGYEELENGTGNYSTAIIELKGGEVLSIPVEHIRFIVGE